METKKSKKADLESKRSLFFTIGLVLSLGFVLLSFSWKTPVQKSEVIGTIDWEAPTDIIIPMTKPEQKEIAPPVKTVMEFVLVDNETDIDDENLEIFDTEISDDAINIDDLMNLGEKDTEYDKEEIVLFPDEMPEFPGGMQALLKFISDAVEYPVVAQENGIQGKVYVNFVINANGQVSNASVLRGVDSSLDKEALRVVNSLPVWKPGKQSGRPVRVSFSVPISFVLQ